MSQPKIIYWAYLSTSDKLNIMRASSMEAANEAINFAVLDTDVKYTLEPIEVDDYATALVTFNSVFMVGNIKIQYEEIEKIKFL